MLVCTFSVISVDAHESGYWHGRGGHHMYWDNGYCPMYPPSYLIQKQDNNTSSADNYIKDSVRQDNTVRPNATLDNRSRNIQNQQ